MNARILSLACMELLKLQLLASYGFLALGRAFPFAASSLAFFASILLAGGLKRAGGLRVFVQLLFHLFAFSLFYLGTFALYSGSGFFPASIFAGITADPLAAAVVLVALGTFWLRGIWLEAAPPTHVFVVARFDEGLLEFLIVLIMAAVIMVENPQADAFAVPYFIFSLLALGISRFRSAQRGGFRAGGKRAVLISAAAAFTLAAYGVVRLVPALGAPARKAAASLGAFTLGILKYIEIFLVWLFKPRSGRPFFVADDSVHLQAPLPESAEGGYSLFGTIVMWIVMGILGCIILFLLALLVVSIVRILAKRSPKPAGHPRRLGAGKWLLAFLTHLSRIFAAPFLRRRRARAYSPAQAAYIRLLACGRAGGIPRAANETPREFASRLELCFPESATGAKLIVEALEAEIYGAHILPEEALKAVKWASGKLKPMGFLRARAVHSLTRKRRQEPPVCTIPS